jgi:hypothetical protein
LLLGIKSGSDSQSGKGGCQQNFAAINHSAAKRR